MVYRNYGITTPVIIKITTGHSFLNKIELSGSPKIVYIFIERISKEKTI